MKKLMRIYRWILLAVLFQVIVFSYLEFIYLPNRGAVKATAFEFQEETVKSRSVKIPSDAEAAVVSYNGSYAAYRQGSKLKVINMGNGRNLKSLNASGGKFCFFRWLPDRDMLIYSIKEPDGKKGNVMISTFDLGAGLERSYPKIKGLPEGSEITCIELSPLTNVVYEMVKTNNTVIKVYKFNIMDNLSYIMNTGVKTVFRETAYTDNLVYQAVDGKITIRNGKTGSKTYLPVKGKLQLLAVDAEDNIYAGQLDDSGKMISVYHGKAGKLSKEWEKTILNTPVKPSDIVITPDGSIYRVNREEKSIYDISDGTRFSFQGELIEVLDDYVVSRDGRRLGLTAIIKEDKE